MVSIYPCADLRFFDLHGVETQKPLELAVGQNQWYHFDFGVGAPPFWCILVGIGMFTKNTGF